MSTTKLQEETIKTYNENIENYLNGTIHSVRGTSLQPWIDGLLFQLPKDVDILKLGTGTGRDADYMEELGYNINRSDASESFLKYNKNKGKQIELLDLLDFNLGERKFDMIYANAVFLHFNKQQLEDIFFQLGKHLKNLGKLAFCVKEGKGEEVTFKKTQAPRFFCYWSKKELKNLLNATGYSEVYIDKNVVTDGQKWIRVLARK